MSERDDLIRALLGGEKVRSLTPEEMVENLSREGYKIVKDDPQAERQRVTRVAAQAQSRWSGGSVVKIGVFSCPHLGSRQQQLTHLEAFYSRCEDEGVTDIFCAGDVCEGDGNVYKGQRYDVFLHGVDAQVEYVIDAFPRRRGITTHAIAGNHDMSFWQRGGADVLRMVADHRFDFRYYGSYGADIVYEGVRIYLSHGDGGVAYARSYKPQRRIEQFAPERKPDVYLLGHYHVFDHLPMYRNVVSWELGCFQSQTEYLRRKGVYPEVAGLIMTIYKGTEGADRSGGFVRVVNEVVGLYVPRQEDF